MDRNPLSSSCQRSSEQGGVLVSLVCLVLTLFVLAVLAFYAFGTIVPPNMIGLRQNSFTTPFFGKKGYLSDGLKPGLHLRVPWISSIVLLPRDFQLIHWNDENLSGKLNLSPLTIPAKDGPKVKTDVTLIFRYYDKPAALPAKQPPGHSFTNTPGVPLVLYSEHSHGGPKELINTFTDIASKQHRILSQKAEGVLKMLFGKLTTIDYYDPLVRETTALNANEQINAAVNPHGIEIWNTLLRRYTYAEEIDKQISDKNFQEATEWFNTASIEFAKAQAKTKESVADWDKKIQLLLQEAKSDALVIRSDGDTDEAHLMAQGDRILSEAKAKVIEAERSALSESTGTEIYLARKMAPLLRTLTGGIVTDIDPYDVREWMKKLLSEEMESDKPAKPKKRKAKSATKEKTLTGANKGGRDE